MSDPTSVASIPLLEELSRKARFKNPDEFDFKMVSHKLVGTKLVKQAGPGVKSSKKVSPGRKR